MDRINKIDKIPGDDKLNVNDDQLTEKIIACAFKVHNALGPVSRSLGESHYRRAEGSPEPSKGA